MEEQYLLELNKFKLAAGAAALYGLYKLYIRRRDKYKQAYKEAKKRCFDIPSAAERRICIHKTMAAFYKQLAQLELDQMHALERSGANPKRINIHARRARFYNELAKVISNPGTPLKDAHQIVSDRLGYSI